MEAAEETLTYRDDTGLHRKLLREDKRDAAADAGRRGDTNSESNYVDLDMKPDAAKTVKVTFTGDGNQLSVGRGDGAGQGQAEPAADHGPRAAPAPALPDTLAEPPDGDPEDGAARAELETSECGEHVRSESDELRYTDMYLNSRSESDDGASAVLSDHCGSDAVEDESHYITTHEIQLTELDHDVDYDLGRETCWDIENDNLVYSFVDYASFESDETQEGTLVAEARGQQADAQAASTEQEESDLCDSDKSDQSDESLCKNGSGDAGAGKIHLSIKTSSRAVKEPCNIFESGTCGYAQRSVDRSHFSFVSAGARPGPLCDRAQYFIPAPGRQHLASKLRRKDINEYSSGASSSISELDDADKEVRNLTAKSFRSLACPYFDAINLSTSSESSLSEYGLNKWSAYVDWNYGNISRGKEPSVIAHKTSSAMLEMNRTADGRRHAKSAAKASHTKTYALNKRTTSQQAPSSGKKPSDPQQRGVTLNFRCNVAPEGAKRPKCPKGARPGCDAQLQQQQQHHADSADDTHKRAIFASSLLKNVISKKMQFEQERKMERGEIRDTYPAPSPCSQDRAAGRGLQRQTSESSSGFTANSADEQHLEGRRVSVSESAEEQKSNRAPDDSEKKESCEPPKAQLSIGQGSAFNSWREDEPAPVKEAEIPTAVGDTKATEELDTSSMLTKLLFVPSCQLISKEKQFREDLSRNTQATGAPAAPQTCEKVLSSGNMGKEEKEKGGKIPEIKICLRSVKENKGCTLNIAKLLTPKISHNTVNTFRTAGDAKCHFLSASDKIPNFTVRDIRDTKCKFQTPIYHVRDVRKLVKSSYRFVSLDNSSAGPSAAGDKVEEKAKKEPAKQLLPSPIVIKCQSVKTNVKSQINEASQKQAEGDIPSETSQSEATPSHCTTSSRLPPVVARQPNPDHSEVQMNAEIKAKQRQEKFSETTERRNEPRIPKQAALEKLKAAVKTMEQLYVFDRNEWKRKTQAPQPVASSHVLSLIAREEQGAEEQDGAAGRLTDPDPTDRVPQSFPSSSEAVQSQQAKGSVNIIHVPYNYDTFQTQQQQQGKTFSNKSVLHFGGGNNKARVSISSVSNSVTQSSGPQTSATMKSPGTPAAPLSLKIEPPKRGQVEQRKVKVSPTNPPVTQASSDSENYLTMPGLGYTSEVQLLNPELVAKETGSTSSQAHAGDSARCPLILEYPASSVYHRPAAAAAAASASPSQHVLCFSPTAAVSPTPSTGDAAPQTQRKMLLDPTTGHYYLVDTRVQATTKRLFDPETGQYVDVPMPHSPVAPVTPVTPVAPVPLSLSPLALSPAAYAPTYMIYPGFIPSPTLAAQAVLPQQATGGETAKGGAPKQEANAASSESVYYSATATGEAPLQLPVNLGHVSTRRGTAGTDRKPVISITTQQGPRIIAPPSFDGTTMSFVLEHR